MLEALRPGQETFTADRLWDVFNKDLFHPPKVPRGRAPFRTIISNSEVGVDSIARKYAFRLFACTADPQEHLLKLDEIFSELVTPNFFLYDGAQIPNEDLVAETLKLLGRLPEHPMLPTQITGSSISDISQIKYFTPCGEAAECCRHGPSLSWEHLAVVRSVNTNVMRFAIQVTIETATDQNSTEMGSAITLLDITARLFQECDSLRSSQSPQLDCRWLVVQAYLWTSWQRMSMLYLYRFLHKCIKIGVPESSLNGDLGTLIPLADSTSDTDKSSDGSTRTQYMCNWAFSLLRSDWSSVTQDFRRLHDVYYQQFGDLKPRCKMTDRKGEYDVCSGTGARYCNRFTGMAPEEQSAHDESCQGDCSKLCWDEQSYRKIQGARAVSLAETKDDLLKYCEASSTTIAISHVWSHGQGGRPETGMNGCLHRRYSSIAKSVGCQSYWMDTPCIPEDHTLRRESISKINQVFSKSKITLVIDRDLKSIDIKDGLDVEKAEALVMAMIVSDWNVRAWTLLEGCRGRINLHLLCKHNRIAPLKDCLVLLRNDARLDSAILGLNLRYFIPHQYQVSPPHYWPSLDDPFEFLKSHYCKSCQETRLHCDGCRPTCSHCRQSSLDCQYFWSLGGLGDAKIELAYLRDQRVAKKQSSLSIEEAACLLHHRHASRLGDEVVIWSLLCNETRVFYSAEDFWRGNIADVTDRKPWTGGRQGHVSTGFLLSSTPRLADVPGLGWAPGRPDVQTVDPSAELFYPSHGVGTSTGALRPNGLEATWAVCYLRKSQASGAETGWLEGSLRRLFGSSSKTDIRSMSKDASAGKDSKAHDMILAQVSPQYKWVALLRPVRDKGNSSLAGIGSYRGSLQSRVALVTSKNGFEWEWQQVYQLAQDISEQDFTKEKLLLV